MAVEDTTSVKNNPAERRDLLRQTSSELAPNIAATFIALYRHSRDSRVLLRCRRNFEMCEHNARKYTV